MISKEQLEEMANIDINDVDPRTLPDLLDVQIDGNTPAERLESYLAQVGNPYCFRVGKTPVQVSFGLDDDLLEERLKTYFLSLKT